MVVILGTEQQFSGECGKRMRYVTLEMKFRTVVGEGDFLSLSVFSGAPGG